MEMVPGELASSRLGRKVVDWVVVVVVPEVVTTVGVVVPCKGEEVRDAMKEEEEGGVVPVMLAIVGSVVPKSEKSAKWVVVQVTV
jgi:hypothetical protein